jgi:hypothetical protein
VGDLAEAMALGEASLRAAEGVGDAVLLTRASLMHANVLRNVGHIAESLTLADRACALTAGTRTWLAAEALWTRAMTHFYGALLDRLADDIAALEQLADQVGHVGATMIGRRTQCNRELLLTGDLVRFRQQTLMELSRPDNAQWSVATRVPLGAGSLALGRIVEARAEFDAVPGVESTVYRGLPEVSLFAVDAWAGEADAARARFDSVERFIARPGELNTIGAWMSAVTAAAALAILAERAACAARYAAIREFMQLGGVVHAMCVGVNASAVAAGIAAGAAGAEAAASEHFGEARALAERLRSPLIRPQVDLFHGRHLVVQDDARRRAEGEAMLRAAADGFATLKMPLHLDLARRWLASY